MRFSQALETAAGDVKRPPNPPAGNYIFTVKSFDFDEIESAKTGETYDKLTFVCSIVEPCEDVDPDELSEFGNVNGHTMRKQFLMSQSADETESKRTIFNVKRFLEHCGLDVESETPLNALMSESVGTSFQGEITHRLDKNDPEIVYAEIGRTARPE